MDLQEHGFLQRRTTMRLFDVQGVEIGTSRERLFDFIRDPRNLPRWAHAFQSADQQRARLQTPSGTADISLLTEADSKTGTVDWRLEFPAEGHPFCQAPGNGTNPGTCIHNFVLPAP